MVTMTIILTINYYDNDKNRNSNNDNNINNEL